jgi:hypothetical protein
VTAARAARTRVVIAHFAACPVPATQDTFALAFALSGHADKYRQVCDVRPTARLAQLLPCRACRSTQRWLLMHASSSHRTARATTMRARCALQVSVPPGGVFRWGPGQLETKCPKPAGACPTTGGYQLIGPLQYDDTGVG